MVSTEWKTIAAWLTDAVLGIDGQKRVCAMNPAAEQLFGRSLAELQGKPVECLVPERYRATHTGKVEAFVRAMESSRALSGPLRVIGLKADGSEVPLDATLLRSSACDAEQAWVVLRDVSARLAMEHEVAKADQRLAQLERLETNATLSAGIAHDFNNTLTVVLSLTRAVLSELPSSTEAHRDLEEVVRAAQRAADLVRRLLVPERDHSPTSEDVNPGACLRELAALCSATAPRNVRVALDLHPTCNIRGDASLVAHALLNLAMNALYAMRERGGVLELAVHERTLAEPLLCSTRTLPPGHWVMLSVRDSGVGIAAEHLPRIFEPFFTTKPLGAGTGLGLAMVHDVVQRAGGAVAVESAVGVGTTVRLYLPPSEHAEARPCQAEPSPSSSARRRVLLLDGDLFVAAALRRGLIQLGHTCHVVSEPRDALELVQHHPHAFDALVCDEHLPALSGRALPELCRNAAPDLRVLLMGDGGPRRGDAAPEGAAVLLKPVSPSDIDEALAAPQPLLASVAPAPSHRGATQ